MTTSANPDENPFVDPTTSFEEHGRGNSFAVDATLAVGKNASLTLGTDSLIVLGEETNSTRNCRICY
jgi:sphingosine kinase